VWVFRVEDNQLARAHETRTGRSVKLVAHSTNGESDDVLINGLHPVLTRGSAHPKSPGERVVVPDVRLVDPSVRKIVQDSPSHLVVRSQP
jgi:hypothetical protein